MHNAEGTESLSMPIYPYRSHRSIERNRRHIPISPRLWSVQLSEILASRLNFTSLLQSHYDQGAILLIDPRGFLMLRYPGNTDPSGIIRDLSRLLRISGWAYENDWKSIYNTRCRNIPVKCLERESFSWIIKQQSLNKRQNGASTMSFVSPRWWC